MATEERDAKGRYIKGPGRPKGTKNRFTSLKEEFIRVYAEHGGAEKLEQLLTDSPRDFFMIFRDLFPKQVESKNQTEIREHATYNDGIQLVDRLIAETLERGREADGLPAPVSN